MESSLYILRGRIGQGDERANKHVDRIAEQLGIANTIITDLLDMIRDKPLVAESVRLRDVVGRRRPASSPSGSTRWRGFPGAGDPSQPARYS
jgi:hypothetical protein